jgi:hypothetical protein
VAFTGRVEGGLVTTSRTATTRTGGGFVLTFPGVQGGTFANGNVNQFNSTSAGSAIVASSITNAGQPGPHSGADRFRFIDLQSGTAIPNSILRVDNERPDPGVLVLTGHPALSSTDADRVTIRNGWINAAYSFAGGKSGQNDAPYEIPGVGLPGTGAVTFHASETASATTWAQMNTIADANPAITTGAALEQSLTNDRYVVVARVVDRLGNRSYVRLTTGAKATGTENRIGADFTIPLMTRLRDVSQYNPGMSDTLNIFQVRIRDQAVLETANFSGPAVVTIDPFRFRVSPADSIIAGAVTTKFLPTDGEVFDRLVSYNTNAITTQAYWMLRGTGWDRAGNRVQSDVYSRIFIKDTTAPVVSNVNIPIVTLFTGGTAYSFSATATDNVDLRAGHFGYDFDNGTSLPVQPFEVSPWHRPIVPEQVVTQNMTFVRNLEIVGADGLPTGTLSRPEWVRVRVWDHSHPTGRHSTQRNNLVANTIPAAGTSFGAAGRGDTGRIREATLSADGRTFTVSGQTGQFLNPFNRIYFIYEVTDPGTAVTYWRILPGSVSTTVEDLGTGVTGRKWIFTYSGTIPATTNVRAVGINASGDALVTGQITTPAPPPAS